ncbi:hypothetical protein [Profundibacterium mesophilum]|nr:hypothetical protein [Profundibacterium mesophilum]
MASRAKATGAGLAVLVILGGLALLADGLRVNRYEGDVIHLVELALRMERGERPHADFMTPIGPLAIWPIALAMSVGLGIGKAFVIAQIALALLCVPLAAGIGARRFGGLGAAAFAALPAVLILSLVHGGTDPGLSISMHYNRWAWALGFIALGTALVPPIRRNALGDGAGIGLPLAALALIKVTYVVGLLPAVLVLLALRRDFGVMAIAAGLAIACLGVFTLGVGAGFWPGYFGDLLDTARSQTRAYPGLSLAQVLTGPAYLVGHVAMLAAVICLRRGGRAVEGLGLLLMLGGLVYITFQNFGNDPLWFAPVGLLLLGLLPAGGGAAKGGDAARTGVLVAALVLAGLGAPYLVNLALSPVRHLAEDRADYVPLLPRGGRHGDLLMETERASRVNLLHAGEQGIAQLAALRARADRSPPPSIGGTALPSCSLEGGLAGWFDMVARDLDTAALPDGSRVVVADLLESLWMFSERIAPLPGGAPWRYGGLPGVQNATHFLVPLCPIDPGSRDEIVRLMAEEGHGLVPVRQTELYTLYEIVPPNMPGIAARSR